MKSVLARTKQDISSVKCPYKDMSNKKVRPTPLRLLKVQYLENWCCTLSLSLTDAFFDR